MVNRLLFVAGFTLYVLAVVIGAPLVIATLPIWAIVWVVTGWNVFDKLIDFTDWIEDFLSQL